jgi:GAF domain-containing protein
MMLIGTGLHCMGAILAFVNFTDRTETVKSANFLAQVFITIASIMVAAALVFYAVERGKGKANEYSIAANVRATRLLCLDTLILSSALTLLWWCLAIEPYLARLSTQLSPTLGIVQLIATISGFFILVWAALLPPSVAEVAATNSRKVLLAEHWKSRRVQISLLAGIMGFLWIDTQILWPHFGAAADTLNLEITVLAPLSFVLAAWLMRTEHNQLAAQQTDETTNNVTAESAEGASLPLRNVLTLVLPCIAMIASIWHMEVFAHNVPTSQGWDLTRFTEMWMAVLILVAATLRHALSANKSLHTTREKNHETTALRSELDRRTQQLMAIHTVSADLNNTLNSEQVLSTALSKSMEILSAEAGAVWLRSDFDLLSRVPQKRTSRSVWDNVVMDRRKQDESAQSTNSLQRDLADDQSSLSAKIFATGKHAQSVFSAHAQQESARVGKNTWSLVRTAGRKTEPSLDVLQALTQALEVGGVAHGARLCSKRTDWGHLRLAPINWQGEIVGVMCVQRLETPFTASDLKLLEILALEVNSALRNAHLYQEARRRAELDGVTELLNHLAVQEKFNHEVTRARNENRDSQW